VPANYFTSFPNGYEEDVRTPTASLIMQEWQPI